MKNAKNRQKGRKVNNLPSRNSSKGLPELGKGQESKPLMLDSGKNSESGASPVSLGISGQSRSGKSAFLYYLLSSLEQTDKVLISGIDPTGILLTPISEMYQRTGKKSPFALGTNADDFVLALERTVNLMLTRIELLTAHKKDKFSHFSSKFPMIYFVVEELGSVMEILKNDDLVQGRKAGERKADKFKALLFMLISQGAKVGCVGILCSQQMRADLLPSETRSNLQVKICLRQDHPDSVRMMAPWASSDQVDWIMSQSVGHALVATPDFQGIGKLHWMSYQAYLEQLGSLGACP